MHKNADSVNIMLIVWFSSFTLSSVNGEKSNIKCYACTNIDTKSFFDDVQAWDLKNWLETTRFVSKTKQCEDKFNFERALETPVKKVSCNNGLCMKMLYTSENGGSHILRSCILTDQNKIIQPECTKIASSKGTLDVCICDKHLCNDATKEYIQTLQLLSKIIMFYSIIILATF